MFTRWHTGIEKQLYDFMLNKCFGINVIILSEFLWTLFEAISIYLWQNKGDIDYFLVL